MKRELQKADPTAFVAEHSALENVDEARKYCKET